MSDIRKRTGAKGITYQVRCPSSATKAAYAYKTFSSLKEARGFLESGRTSEPNALSRHSKVRTVPQAFEMWLDACEEEGRDERNPVSPSTLENYRLRARTMKSFGWGCALHELKEPDIIAFRSRLKRTCSMDQGQKVLLSFHSVLIEMRRRGIIHDDPGQHVTIRRNLRRKGLVRIPSINEMQEILRAADRLANSKTTKLPPLGNDTGQ